MQKAIKQGPLSAFLSPSQGNSFPSLRHFLPVGVSQGCFLMHIRVAVCHFSSSLPTALGTVGLNGAASVFRISLSRLIE